MRTFYRVAEDEEWGITVTETGSVDYLEVIPLGTAFVLAAEAQGLAEENKRLREALAATFDALRTLRSCAGRWDPERYQTEIEEADAAIAGARPALGYADPPHVTPSPAQGDGERTDTSSPAPRG